MSDADFKCNCPHSVRVLSRFVSHIKLLSREKPKAFAVFFSLLWRLSVAFWRQYGAKQRKFWPRLVLYLGLFTLDLDRGINRGHYPLPSKFYHTLPRLSLPLVWNWVKTHFFESATFKIRGFVWLLRLWITVWTDHVTVWTMNRPCEGGGCSKFHQNISVNYPKISLFAAENVFQLLPPPPPDWRTFLNASPGE